MSVYLHVCVDIFYYLIAIADMLSVTLQYSVFNEIGILNVCHFLKGVALNENILFEIKVKTQLHLFPKLHELKFWSTKALYFVHQYYVHWHTVTNLHLIYIYLQRNKDFYDLLARRKAFGFLWKNVLNEDFFFSN